MNTKNLIRFSAFPHNSIEYLRYFGVKPIRSIGSCDAVFAVCIEEGDTVYYKLEVEANSASRHGFCLTDKSECELFPCLNTCPYNDFYVAMMPRVN